MAHCVTVPSQQPDHNPWDLHGRRRERVLASCPLACIHMNPKYTLNYEVKNDNKIRQRIEKDTSSLLRHIHP